MMTIINVTLIAVTGATMTTQFDGFRALEDAEQWIVQQVHHGRRNDGGHPPILRAYTFDLLTRERRTYVPGNVPGCLAVVDTTTVPERPTTPQS